MIDVVVLKRIKKRGNDFIDLGTVTIPRQYLEITLKAHPYFEIVQEDTVIPDEIGITPPKTAMEFICPICGKECKHKGALSLHKYHKHKIRNENNLS